jgi:hypothetical protein
MRNRYERVIQGIYEENAKPLIAGISDVGIFYCAGIIVPLYARF